MDEILNRVASGWPVALRLFALAVVIVLGVLWLFLPVVVYAIHRNIRAMARRPPSQDHRRR